MWTVLGHDWEWDTDRVVGYVLRRISAGGIVCLHDGRDIRVNPDISVTLQVVPLLVARLRGAGYSFATVSELLRGGESTVDYSSIGAKP